MTLLEMKDKRGLLLTDNAELSVKIKKENRKFTDEEQKLFDENVKLAGQLEKDILVEQELRMVPEAKMVVGKNLEEGKPFSLFAAIDNEINHRSMDAPTVAMINEGRAEFAKAGGDVQASGQIILPYESKIVKRTAIVAGGTTTGGYIVQTDKKAVLPPLTNYLVLTQAGATYLTGLVGSVSIPTYSGTTVAWKEETVSAADGAGTWGKVDLAPKRLTAYLDVSKQFLAQDSVGAENMLYDNLAKAIAAKLESTILGTGEGSSVSTPAGLFWSVYTAGATTLSWSSIVALETTIDSANNLAQNMAYLTSAAGRGAAKTTLVTSTYGDRMIMAADGTINGYPVYVSNGVAKTTDFATTTGFGFIFGNWADLIIGQWGGYDLTIDPYSQAVYANVRLVVNCYFDAAAARTTSSFAPKHMA
jgi:HK97 family phage major capsid protein